MSKSDSYVDGAASTSNFGRGPFLSAGRSKAIFVRFPQLGRSIGAGRRVLSANLEMTLVNIANVRLRSVSRVLKPWGEGGTWSRDYENGNKPQLDGGATWQDAQAGPGRLKWGGGGGSRDSDGEPLSNVTATLVEGVVVLSGLERAVQRMVDDPQSNFGFRITFESRIDFFSADSFAPGPTLNIEFADAQMQAAPDLAIVSCEPAGFNPQSPPKKGSNVTWMVRFVNNGDVMTESQQLTWSYAGKTTGSRAFSMKIGAGEAAELTFTLPWEDPSPNRGRQAINVRVFATEGDLRPSDNGITVYMGALAVAVPGVDPATASAALQNLNEAVFPFSKFSASPKGCLERLRYVHDPAQAHVVVQTDGEDLITDVLKALTGLPDAMLRPFSGSPPVVTGLTAPGYLAASGQIGLLPDTRDDILVPRPMPIPDRSAKTRLFMAPPMREHRLLSRTETTILNSLIGKPSSERELPWHMTTSAIFFKVISSEGVVPVGARLDVFQLVGGAFGSQPVFSAMIESSGIVLMPSRPSGAFGRNNPFGNLSKDGSNSWLLAVVRQGSSAYSSWIPVWQLWDEYARGNTAGGFVEVRVNLVAGSLDRGTNLALNKLVTDSKSRFPAQLMSIVDGKTESSLELSQLGEGYWLEIDLGRDRQIGEIGLVFDGPVWKEFRIVTFKTAQSPDVAQVWAEEDNGPGNPEIETTDDGRTVLRYRSKSVRSRFIRIYPLSGEDVKLAEVLVVPVRN